MSKQTATTLLLQALITLQVRTILTPKKWPKLSHNWKGKLSRKRRRLRLKNLQIPIHHSNVEQPSKSKRIQARQRALNLIQQKYRSWEHWKRKIPIPAEKKRSLTQKKRDPQRRRKKKQKLKLWLKKMLSTKKNSRRMSKAGMPVHRLNAVITW